jgi:hypothetical protein
VSVPSVLWHSVIVPASNRLLSMRATNVIGEIG